MNKTSFFEIRAKFIVLIFDSREQSAQTQSPSNWMTDWLTCLQKHFSPIQVLHFIAVILGISCAWSSASRFCPMHFRKTFSMQLQWLDFGLSTELQDNFPRDDITAAEHGWRVDLGRVENDV